MIKINLICDNKAWYQYIKNPSDYIQKKTQKLNRKYQKYKKKTIFCTLLLSGSKEIKKLNRKFRKKNKSTDVLSFPFYNKKELKIQFRKKREIYLGDIIVNLNKISLKHKKKKFKLHLDKLWIHGLVHLYGYDHKKENDYLKMLKVEKKLLSYLD